ncbi:MAG: hypothetical protein ACK4EY_15070 [Flavipsychrobacter sp.]
MARTRAQWEAIYTSPATVLGMITSGVAEWLGLRDLTISVAMRLEEIFELLKSDVDTKLASKQAGSIYWYPDAIKEFQYGDSLIIEDGVAKYAVIDESKRIIKVVSIRKRAGGMDIKMAKDDGSGNLIALDNAELLAVDDYIDNRFSPGDGYLAISRDADVIKYTIIGKYDPLYSKADVQTGITDALEAFKFNFGFDPTFYKAQVYEDIMAVPGMKSLLLQIDMTLNNGTETVTDLVEYKVLPAGYFNWDVASTISLTPAL